MEDDGYQNDFEHSNGRWGSTIKGDILPCVLGNRHALKEFIGHVPSQLAPGQRLDMLAESGLVGLIEGENNFYSKKSGSVLPLKFLGYLLGKDGKPMNTIFAEGCPIRPVHSLPR